MNPTHSTALRRAWALAAGLALALALAPSLSCAAGGGLEGVWTPVSIRTLAPGAVPSQISPQPGLFFFGGRHYCHAWVPGQASRAPSARRWFPTEAEKAAMFDTVILNAGTYTVNGSEIEVRPTVAKTPEFAGGRAVWRYEVQGDTLRLENLDIVSSDGIRDPGVGRVRTLILLVRVE
jgi:hypothetical protein